MIRTNRLFKRGPSGQWLVHVNILEDDQSITRKLVTDGNIPASIKNSMEAVYNGYANRFVIDELIGFMLNWRDNKFMAGINYKKGNDQQMQSGFQGALIIDPLDLSALDAAAIAI